MIMNRFMGAVVLSVALALSLPITAKASDRDDRRKAAAVIGVIVGAAALAAASKHHRHKQHRRHGGQSYAYGAPFSPKRNVTCYPRERVCYRRNGRIAGGATHRYFGN
jgi:hypothetical protein